MDRFINNTNIKRTKGKRNSDINLKEQYEFYCIEMEKKSKRPKDFKTYSSIIKRGNELIREAALNSNTIKLPYAIGWYGIIKYKSRFDEENQRFWKVDYKRSKELGQIVYFDNDYKYKWKWVKHGNLTGASSYKFIPCREASRLIAKCLRDNKKLDYFEKLDR